MCGIVGWALERGKGETRETLARLANMMTHRGPDGSGHWLEETADNKYQIALGHMRLSIIDIDGGIQPMTCDDGSVVLITNGEIYNFIELREELRALGHTFRTNSDTEVMIEAYRAWGVDALRRFRGMFAFALWDARSQKLLLGRDAFGKKPLFLATAPGGIIFGSEIEPLLNFPGVSREVEPDALGHYLLNRYVPGPLTFFRSVRKLQPGCYGEWKGGRLSIVRYFTPPIGVTEPDIGGFGEAVEAFESVFDESVKIRMRSDAPFGAYLSGGIDSSAVVATMTRHSTGGPVRTFSVGFNETAYSELSSALMVAKQFNTAHEELVVNPSSFIAAWPEAIRRRGAPVSEPSDIPILMLSHAARGSVKMVLTGEGSDEFLGGYPKHRAERWVKLYQQVIPRALHKSVVAPTTRALPFGMRRLKILVDAAGERNSSVRLRAWFGGINMPKLQMDRMTGFDEALVPPDPFPFSAQTTSALRRTLFFDQTSWLPDNLLERGDRMMMAGSIEGRMPFMDVELARLVARFPDRFLIGGKGGKAVLRAAMSKVLPEKILTRRKIGFRVPFEKWFRETQIDFVRGMLLSDSCEVARVLDSAKLRALVKDHIDGKQNNEKELWSLLNLEMFIRQFRPTGIAGDCLRAA